MKLLSWNVNGIRAISKKGFTDFLKKVKPDILGIQEIKISNESRLKEKFDFYNYDEYWNPAEKPGYSGTAILSKIKPLLITKGIGIKKFDQEGRVQTLEYSKFYFVNTYFPNAQSKLKRIDYKEEFNKEVLKYIKKLDKKKPVIITGDLNVAREEIDLTNPKPNIGNPGFSNQERAWARKYLDAGFIDTFRYFYPDKIQYSWWSYRFNARSKNIGWRIDYFLVSSRIIKQIKTAYILDKVMGSDHAPIGIELEL